MNKKKISFDFDGTLSESQGQRRAQTYIDNGDIVYITTARQENYEFIKFSNEDLFEISAKLKIPKTRIRFTAYEDKWKYLKDFDFHFDNDELEITLINANTNCIGVLIKYE